ncbi:SYC2L protein, partial [Polypterus senegalus]
MLTILMEVPISSNKKNGEVVKIFFELQFDILTAAKMVFGPHKEMEKKYEPTPAERVMQASVKGREPQKPWHLKSTFSESDISMGQSEKSFDIEFKHKTPLKLVEYSRKKPKAKPKVKAASPYSSADEQVSLKMKHSTPKLPESLKDKESGPSTELSFQAENPPAISALLTPVSGPLLDATKDQKRFRDDTSEHPAEEQMTTHLQPKKLFSSSETCNAAEDEYVSDAMLYEDSDSGTEGGTSIIAAFENFNQELRKKFWARHRKMELQAQRALKVSKHTISDMLSHLHQCRLQRLSKFQSIVIHELSSLEKDAQSLMQMETDTMVRLLLISFRGSVQSPCHNENFWKTQSQKLSSFCEIQEKKQFMAEDPQRNFRSIYYEKVGFRGVEEKKSLEILLKDDPLVSPVCVCPITVPALLMSLLIRWSFSQSDVTSPAHHAAHHRVVEDVKDLTSHIKGTQSAKEEEPALPFLLQFLFFNDVDHPPKYL